MRAHRMPADLKGDYLYGEVVGRIVRRVRAEKQDGVTRIRNYYDGNEFIKSTDPYFRPVDQTTAPDGTIYITDLYHGIIQEATWARPGTYLRARIQQYDLDKVIHKGRIWRLVYDGVRADRSDALARDTTMPRMLDETPPQLLAHLGAPQRVVARYRAAVARVEAGQVGGPAVAGTPAGVEQPAREVPRPVDARRAQRARRRVGAARDGPRANRACAFRRFARARHSTRRAIDRSPPTTSA